uniref:Uncharacterized protein n=1 Tax=Acrobeloides nanus TaxID=290746 RepID=A0A914C0L4_9BILA
MTICNSWEDCRPKYSYKSLLKEGQVLMAEYVSTFGPYKSFESPFGIVYDEVNEKWFAAVKNSNSLRSFSTEFDVGEIISTKSLKQPSALTIFNPGRQIGILDNHNISIYDYSSGNFITIANAANCRGLGITDKGDFVTVKSNEILFYSPMAPNKVLHRHPYIVQGNGSSSPCFFDISSTKLCITDLGHQSFTLYDLKVDTLELAVQKQAILNGSDIGQFGYIAGVRFDSSEEFIIVDAKNHKFLYFDKEGNFLHRVKCSKLFTSTNSFHINNKNFMMTCEYKANRLNLYQLKGVAPNVIELQSRTTSNSSFSSASTGLQQRGRFGASENGFDSIQRRGRGLKNGFNNQNLRDARVLTEQRINFGSSRGRGRGYANNVNFNDFCAQERGRGFANSFTPGVRGHGSADNFSNDNSGASQGRGRVFVNSFISGGRSRGSTNQFINDIASRSINPQITTSQVSSIDFGASQGRGRGLANSFMPGGRGRGSVNNSSTFGRSFDAQFIAIQGNSDDDEWSEI